MAQLGEAYTRKTSDTALYGWRIRAFWYRLQYFIIAMAALYWAFKVI